MALNSVLKYFPILKLFVCMSFLLMIEVVILCSHRKVTDSDGYLKCNYNYWLLRWLDIFNVQHA